MLTKKAIKALKPYKSSDEIDFNFRATWNIANIEYYTNLLLKKPDSWYFSFWIDYLTFSLTKKQTDLLNWFLLWNVKINETNTNELLTRLNSDEIFHVTKTRTSNWEAYTFSITYETIPVSIFQFIIYWDIYKETFNINSSLKLFWWYYRLEALWNIIPNNLKLFLQDFTNWALISRIDYRYDFIFKEFLPVPLINTILPKKRKNKKRKPYYTWDELESWDCWKKINKNVFIRLYNKNIELVKKLKWLYLYWDILKEDYKTFHRLEYEFWQKYTAWFFWSEIDELIQKINRTTWIHTSNFTKNMYKPKRVIDLTNELDRNRYIKVFKSMAKTLKTNWLDPNILFNDSNDIISNDDIIDNISKELKLIWLDNLVDEFIDNIKESLKDKFNKK